MSQSDEKPQKHLMPIIPCPNAHDLPITDIPIYKCLQWALFPLEFLLCFYRPSNMRSSACIAAWEYLKIMAFTAATVITLYIT